MNKTASDFMICYYRLSSEDGDVARGNAAESFSISAQRLCVRNFLASRPDLEGTVEEIVDDGYTGTNMNRPGMQRLLSLVKSGSVKTVIVRDLSRFPETFWRAATIWSSCFRRMASVLSPSTTTLTAPTMVNPPVVWSWASPTC